MKKILTLTATLLLGLAFPLASLATDNSRAAMSSAATSSGPTLTVRAYIDGRSDLILHNNTVQWHHYDYAAPGRWNGNNYPTYLNGIAWNPTWPDVPTSENRDCNCSSSTHTGVPSLPANPQTVNLTIVQARSSASIVQQPNAQNDYTLVLEFNDNPIGYPDWYEVNLTYKSCTNEKLSQNAAVQQLRDSSFINYSRELVGAMISTNHLPK